MITKVTKPVAPYQVFTSAEVGAGEIIDVQTSLGGVPAREVTFENLSASGISFQLNVCEKVYRQYGFGFEPWVTGFQGSRSPIAVGEIVKDLDTFTVQPSSGLTIDNLGVVDIKLVTFADGAKITVM